MVRSACLLSTGLVLADQECDTAHHFDARGLGWQKGSNCSVPHCYPGNQPKNISAAGTPIGCQCNTAAVVTLLDGPGGAAWKAAFGPEMGDALQPPCLVPGKGAVPCKNQVVDNSYCKAGKFIDATQAQTDGWDSTVKDNKEVPCKYQKEPPAFGHPRMG